MLQTNKISKDTVAVVYIIANASIRDGKLSSQGILMSDTYEDAIILAQDSIASDFGYYSWTDYLSDMDPEITERNGIYTIRDETSGHEESYRIEKFVG